MKILLVNTNHYRGGGDSTYTFNLAELLRSKGHEIAFFAMKNERNEADPNQDFFVEDIDFREMAHAKTLRNATSVLSRSIYSAHARENFAKLLDRVQPDLIHLQAIHAHITPSVIFEAKKRRLPVVWTLHDYKLICPNTHFLIDSTSEICEACGRGRFYQPILKRCKKNSLAASAVVSLEAYVHKLINMQGHVDVFLTPSSFLRKKLISRGFPSSKVFHVPNFLPDDMFRFSPEDHGYFLFFGRLSTIKGVRTLIEASRMCPDIEFRLAGRIEGPLIDEIPTFLPPNAKYVGLKHGEELWRLLEGARAVVVPSLWYENQPFSILEAFARGKPVIASDLGGMTELIGREERGLLVPAGDAAALADAMHQMLSDHGRRDAMALAAFDYVRSIHTPEVHYKLMLDIYHQVISR